MRKKPALGAVYFTRVNADINAILLVADISGWTKFVRKHAVSASHARQIVVRLLKAIISVTEPPLTVAELEGDAVFLYALCEAGEAKRVAAQVKAQVPRMFRAFKDEMRVLTAKPRCSCDSCWSVEKLRLKQVVHAGEVALEQIGKFEKLFGFDVIVVHRMLKNSLDAKKYLMLTERAYHALDGFYDMEPEERTEKLDGVGPVAMKVFSAEQIEEVVGRAEAEEGAEAGEAKVSLGRLLMWRLKLQARTMVDLAARLVGIGAGQGTE